MKYILLLFTPDMLSLDHWRYLNLDPNINTITY